VKITSAEVCALLKIDRSSLVNRMRKCPLHIDESGRYDLAEVITWNNDFPVYRRPKSKIVYLEYSDCVSQVSEMRGGIPLTNEAITEDVKFMLASVIAKLLVLQEQVEELTK